jgi:hypothetical protein
MCCKWNSHEVQEHSRRLDDFSGTQLLLSFLFVFFKLFLCKYFIIWNTYFIDSCNLHSRNLFVSCIQTMK